MPEIAQTTAQEVEIPKLNGDLDRPLWGGIIGCGFGFIGKEHKRAVQAEDTAVWIGGVPDYRPEVSRALWKYLRLQQDRTYGSLQDMLQQEPGKDPALDWVSVCTPNHVHFDQAAALITAGYNVMLEKPMCHTVDQAQQLIDLIHTHKVVLALTHTYFGHPMIRMAEDLIAQGCVGDVETVVGWYWQDWLRKLLETAGVQQAIWRTDKSQSGRLGCGVDILTHILQMVVRLSGANPIKVRASLRTLVEGRGIDDNVFAEVQASKNGKDVAMYLTASQTMCGEMNNFGFRITGTKGTLLWNQQFPEQLTLLQCGEPDRVYHRNPGANWATPAFKADCILPGGHPEGYSRAEGNVYGEFFSDVIRRLAGGKFGRDYGCQTATYPNVFDGFTGVAMINGVANSHEQDSQWVTLAQPRIPAA